MTRLRAGLGLLHLCQKSSLITLPWAAHYWWLEIPFDIPLSPQNPTLWCQSWATHNSHRLQNPHFKRLVVSGRLHLCDFVGPDDQLFSSAEASATDAPSDFWSDLQLCNFFCRCSRILGISRHFTKLEQIYHRGGGWSTIVFR